MRHLGALRVATEPLAEFRCGVDMRLRVLDRCAPLETLRIILDH